jgi:hypothetical protein
MHRAARRVAVGIIVGMLGMPAVAQERLTARADAIFYGDNTEFRNPFREGETIFGAAVQAAVDVDVNERARLSLGVFGNHRFGGDDSFELVRPAISLTLKSGRSSLIFGTLPMPRPGHPPGPDRTGPHALLPPLQRETLAFDRPYEAGMAWTFDGVRFRHGLWLNWQRVNTPSHRERFDAGADAQWHVRRNLAVPLQLHLVHQGGQLFAAGPVTDSVAAAVGVRVAGRAGRIAFATLEGHALASRFVPDRERPDRSRSGAAFFARAAAEHAGWRAHLIVWRGDDFITDEGDPNYLAVRRDGTRWRGVRDYSETGLTRTFDVAPGVRSEASARIHRVERHYEYSYRILAVVNLAHRIR